MVFSSITFLFLFLPCLLLVFFVAPIFLRSCILLIASFLFYFWGSAEQTYLVILSIGINYLCGLSLDYFKATHLRRSALVVGLAANIGLLFYFKYFNFFIDSTSLVLSYLNFEAIELARVTLPIGISFFTFQAMSYVIDAYRGSVPVQRNPIYLALYILLFPQLIAGPIVRYIDIRSDLTRPSPTLEMVVDGITRFIIGLAKKVLIANTMGEIADTIFAASPSQFGADVAWLGIIAYTLQIYFDFSGYSDMAIGLGRIFGFRFLENFNFPYCAKSITDFWRRWHISLSTWFRDYLYIPLGGNRISRFRTFVNLYIVFILCGLWHGAGWTFVFWGFWHGSWLVFERSSFGQRISALAPLFARTYTLLIVIVGWVFFRSESFSYAWNYLLRLLSVGSNGPVNILLSKFLTIENILFFSAALLASTPIFQRYVIKIRESYSDSHSIFEYRGIAALLFAYPYYILIFGLSVLRLAANQYNPFIYFRF